MRIVELAEARVAIWGFGREGRAVLAALRSRLPALPLTVLCSEVERAAVDAVSQSNLAVQTAVVDAELLAHFDVVIKSPGISAYRPEIAAARASGTRFTSATALWFAENPSARVIAVTGTKGKSTTTALIAHLLRACGRRVALAGNIGMPLLELLDVYPAPDWWVVELSSFQTREAGAVEIGLVNNLYDEHLDWHGTRERYAADKLALVDRARTLIVNGAQSELLARTQAHARRLTFGDARDWHVADSAIFRGDARVLDIASLPLPGAHNALNVCAALATVEAAGEDAVTAAHRVASFRPLPHRLQSLGERDGVLWIDDSIATTPQATLEALASLRDRAVSLLIGGFDRGLDWNAFAQELKREPPQGVFAFGAIAPRVLSVLDSVGGDYLLRSFATLAEAVDAAQAATPRGGAIVLSPGAPSFDAFRDYAERGRVFATLGGFADTGSDRIVGLGIA